MFAVEVNIEIQWMLLWSRGQSIYGGSTCDIEMEASNKAVQPESAFPHERGVRRGHGHGHGGHGGQ